MPKIRPEVIMSATLEVSKSLPAGSRFRASKVRDHLHLPVGRWYNEAIRECWRQNQAWLVSHGLRLISEPKRKVTWWYLVRE